MDRFDTDNAATFSAAARDLNELKPGLQEAIAGCTAAAAAEARHMTKDAMLAEFGEARAPKRTATAADFTKAFVDRRVQQSAEHQELARLNDEAAKDRYIATRLNQAMDAPETVAAKIREATDMTYAIKWYGMDVMIAGHLAHHAYMVHRAVTTGGLDLRAAILAVLPQATYKAMSFAASASGAGADGHGMDRVAEARAGGAFVKMVAGLLGDMLPTSVIAQ